MPDSDESIAKPHPDPTEVVMLDPTNCKWSVSSCQCTYLLLWTLLRDAQSLNDFLKDYSPDLVKEVGKRYRKRTGSAHPWMALQLPVFDMLRSIFARYGKIVFNLEYANASGIKEEINLRLIEKF